MADYRYAGVHVLNDFIFSRLVAEGILDTADYGTVSPFFPTQQTAFTNALPSTFFIYTFQQAGQDDLYPIKIEQALWSVYDDDSRKLRDVINFMSDLLKRMDDTAKEVNEYILARGEYPNEFDFKYVRLLSANSPEPFTMPEGRQAGLVSVRYQYTQTLDQAGMRA